MKELSIEEKAKAYDEAIERANELIYVSDKNSLQCKTVENIFPELKKSDDERIRKEILEYFQQFENEELRGVNISDWIAWLKKKRYSEFELENEYWRGYDDCKKQGEQTSFNNTQEYLKGVDRVQNYEELTKFEKGFDRIADTYAHNKNKKGYNQSWYTKERAAEMLYWAKEELGLLEKQGEQKQDPCKNCKNVRLNCHNFPCIKKRAFEQGKSVFEVINEETVDKVEPRFKVGDWVVSDDKDVHDDYRVCKITRINDGRYYIENGDFLSESSLALYEYRLWTIQDAEDGDVLFISSTASHETFIFKSIDKNNNATCYFAYDSEDGFREGKYHFIGSATNCKPATKEQRYLLFQKMKEAGYEWDAEKKKLKKIEQKPVEANCTNDKGVVSSKEEGVLGEMIAEWSEEDVKTMQYIFRIVKDSGCSNRCYNRIAKFLRNITPNPQSKQEWSEEDEDTIKFLISHFCISHCNRSFQFTSDKLITCDELLEKIRNLRPQNWTKEDKERYISCLQRLGTGNPEQPETINSKWFKEHVYSQSHWKPSDEQMIQLKKYCPDNRPLTSLYEQLKKLREK